MISVNIFTEEDTKQRFPNQEILLGSSLDSTDEIAIFFLSFSYR